MKDNILIYPTDTVWGIGYPIFDQEAAQKLDIIKGRDADKPLSVLFDSLDSLNSFFSFEERLKKDWLEKFFSMESTLLVPISWSLKSIPKWVIKQSDYVGVRVLDQKGIKELIKKAGGPVTTTSLNLSGDQPCVEKNAAKLFHENYVPNAYFFDLEDLRPSGASSTIVLIEENLTFRILREGRFSQQVKSHVQLLST